MKAFFKWVPWVLVGCLVVVILLRPSEAVVDTSKQVNEIKEIRSDRDSLTKIINLKTDTLEAVRGRVEHLEFQLSKARKERKELIQAYNEITFKRFNSDTARLNAWAKLFPSVRSR
jgi:uncharacterized membrane protein (UPF0182 family)